MQRVQDLYLKAQRPDGGWNYTAESGDPSYGSMTAAAVASLFITRDYLNSQIGCPCQSGRSARRPTVVDRSIDAGIQWLATNFTAKAHPGYHTSFWYIEYWLYSTARVGLASGYSYFGPHHWYREGADTAIKGTVPTEQHFWIGCFNTMFLIRGKAPLLFNKLQFKGGWNLHPRDLANLTQYIGEVKEQTMSWQILPLEAPRPDWHDAPILYISAEEKFDLTPEQKDTLRWFTETGGTIFFEASCANHNADAWWRILCKEIWPQYEFQKVDKDHPLWTADVPINGPKPLLWSLNDGLRSFVFLAPVDLSCTWNLSQKSKYLANFQIGENLYMYATDKSPLRARLAAKAEASALYASAKLACGPKAKLKIARLKTSGDFYVGDRYQPLAAFNVGRPSGAPELVPAAEPIEANSPQLKDLDVVWLTGRQDATLSPEAAKALKDYLAGGGFLFAEAALGDERFQKSFEATAAALGLTIKPLAATDGLLTGQIPGAAGYDLAKTRYAFHLKIKRIGQQGAVLHGLYLGGKLVGVFSPFDIMFSLTGNKAFGNLGYEAEDARAVATNVLLLASTGPSH
jgi:hypothetical protein